MRLSRSPRRRTVAWAATALTVTGLRLAHAEAERGGGRTGERIAEPDARIALAVSLFRLADDDAARETLDRAEKLVRAFPCPAGTRHAARQLVAGDRSGREPHE